MNTHSGLKIDAGALRTDIFDDISVYLAMIEGKWPKEKSLP